jgi:hypothetical protein
VEKQVYELEANGEIEINGVKLFLISEDRWIEDAEGCPMVAFYPPEDDLWRLDNIKNVIEMLLVPFVEKEAVSWIGAWKAKPLHESSRTSSSTIIEP